MTMSSVPGKLVFFPPGDVFSTRSEADTDTKSSKQGSSGSNASNVAVTESPLRRKFSIVVAAVTAGLAGQVAASSSGRMKTDLFEQNFEVIFPPQNKQSLLRLIGSPFSISQVVVMAAIRSMRFLSTIANGSGRRRLS